MIEFIKTAREKLSAAAKYARENPKDAEAARLAKEAEEALDKARERKLQSEVEGIAGDRDRHARELAQRLLDARSEVERLAPELDALEEEQANFFARLIAGAPMIDALRFQINGLRREAGIPEIPETRMPGRALLALAELRPEVASGFSRALNPPCSYVFATDPHTGVSWARFVVPAPIAHEIHGSHPLAPSALAGLKARLSAYAKADSHADVNAALAKLDAEAKAKAEAERPQSPPLERRGTFFGTAVKAVMGTPGAVNPLQEPSNLSPGDIDERRRANAERIILEAEQSARARRASGGDPGPSAA